MNGIILINKEKGITSRDVVNKVSKKLNTKHVGHAGTLDPLATGLMVLGINKGTKILELLTLDKKEYIATVRIGIQTDTYDIIGTIIKKNSNYNLGKEELLKAFNHFSGTYLQTVPKYSAVKINGKKLYEYARGNIDIELPKREVSIYEIELLSFDNNTFKFRTVVSKGTYIRSLINDIGEYLNIPMTMEELVRTKSGIFKLEDSNDIDSEYNIISIKDSLDIKSINVVDKELLKKIKNGNIINYESNLDYILFLEDNSELAIYKKIENFTYKAFRVF